MNPKTLPGALERNVLIAIAGTWVWPIGRAAPSWTFLIPVLFALLGSLRAYGIMRAFGRIGAYIKTLEGAFTRPDGPAGWQHFQKGTGAATGAVLFWACVVVATAIVLVFIHYNPPSPVGSISVGRVFW